MRSSGPRAVCYEMSVAETLLEEIVCNRSWPICNFARQVKYRKTDSHLFYTIHAFSRCTTRECMLRHPQTSRPLRSEEKKRRKHKKYATAQSARKPRHSLRTLQPRHISYAVHNASSTHRLPTPLTRSRYSPLDNFLTQYVPSTFRPNTGPFYPTVPLLDTIL